MLENTVNYYESTLFKLEQLLRARSHQVGRSGGAGNTKQALRTFIPEPPKPQKAAADQMDNGQAIGQAKTLLGQSVAPA